MDEKEHSTSPETPASGETAPVTRPAAGSGRDRRGDGVRDVITSRGAGWAVAAAMAGAVAGLSVAMTASSSPTIVVQDGAAGLRGTPAGAARAALPGGALRDVALSGRGLAQAPARLRIWAPARLRIQVPAEGPLQAPARLWIQGRTAGALQAPAQLRLALAPASAGPLIPLPVSSQLLSGVQAIGDAMAPRAVRLRVRPGQVRVRLRVPANGRLQVLPGNAVPGQLRVVVPGPGSAALVPAAPARLRIVSRNGATIPARLLIPAGLPGQARLRIQVPARARI